MSWLIGVVLNWITGKIVALLTGFIKVFTRRQEIIDKEHKSVEPLKQADPKDAKAIDDAAKDALGGF